MDFGLLGKSLKHSFSKKYFTQKFKDLGLDHNYENYEINSIKEVLPLLNRHPLLRGLNVTIPYKQDILPYLNTISDDAREIGAVNTIVITDQGLSGYNTDVYGFEKSLLPLLQPMHTKALVLGSGGASNAVVYVLKKLGIKYKVVSRYPVDEQIDYKTAKALLSDHYLVINTTPAGMFPDLEETPPLSLELTGENHLFYDLIYNPAETLWLKKAKKKGAVTKNGEEMLKLQAERSWEIWNNYKL